MPINSKKLYAEIVKLQRTTVVALTSMPVAISAGNYEFDLDAASVFDAAISADGTATVVGGDPAQVTEFQISATTAGAFNFTDFTMSGVDVFVKLGVPLNLQASGRTILKGLYDGPAATLDIVMEEMEAYSTPPPPPSSTWNPADKGSGITLTNSDLTASKTTGGFTAVRGVQSRSSGKYYFEVTCGAGTSGVDLVVGVMDSVAALTSYPGNPSASYKQSAGYWGNSVFFYNITSGSSTGVASFTASDVIGVSVDFAAKDISVYKNGTLISTHTAGVALNAMYPAAGIQNTGSGTIETSSVLYLPSGFTAWG